MRDVLFNILAVIPPRSAATICPYRRANSAAMAPATRIPLLFLTAPLVLVYTPSAVERRKAGP